MAAKKAKSKTSALRVGGFSTGTSSVGKFQPSKFTAVMPKEEPGFLSILSTDPPLAMKLRLGPTPAQIAGGVGGWTQVDRPRRQSAVEWQSTPVETLVVQVVFDGWPINSQIESEIAALKSLGIPGGVSLGRPPVDVEPPVLRLGGMVPHSSKKWVLSEIEWDSEDTIWHGLQRFRQFANITFLEYVQAKPVKTRRPAAPKKAAGGRTRTVKAKKGDTVTKIVKRELKPKTGAALKTAVSKVKKLNSIRDAKKVLKTGRAIKLPASGAK